MTDWTPTPPTDRGDADPAVRAALAAAYSGGNSYASAVAALCTARLILPTAPAPDDAEPGASEGQDDGHEHGHTPPGHVPMAAVLMKAASGDKAVVAFTGYDAMNAWGENLHPVRCTLDDVAATCAETHSNVILIDPQGPHPLVIEQQLIDELAQGHRLVELPDGSFGWMYLAPDAPSAG